MAGLPPTLAGLYRRAAHPAFWGKAFKEAIARSAMTILEKRPRVRSAGALIDGRESLDHGASQPSALGAPQPADGKPEADNSFLVRYRAEP